MTLDVRLRAVEPRDLAMFFENQRDPEAVAMAEFPSRERPEFDAHWARILAEPETLVRTIEADGEPVGNVTTFDRLGLREVGYVIARSHWGRGIATRALTLFLALEPRRPLVARVVKHNVASRRVLEKCGFRVAGEAGWPPEDASAPLTDWVYELV
jgi:RimJ/RimL family protein N-acetyltransferase